MGSNRVPAEVFPPGEFVKDELDARGWTQTDLASIMGRPERLISEIVNGKKLITPETATGLGAAFGTSAEYWLNLQTAYQLSRVESSDGSVARRAAIYDKVPIKALVKRGWIEDSENIDVLEHQVLRFFGVSSIHDDFTFRAAARKSTKYTATSPLQVAWMCRAKALAVAVKPKKVFDPITIKELPAELRRHAKSACDAKNVVDVLSSHGVRFVIVAPLPASKIDGACFWLSERDPAIALSLRTDTIDGFWFTLMHEVAHVINGDGHDGGVVDEDIKSGGDDDLPRTEREANRLAEETLVPRAKLDPFIERNAGRFFESVVTKFANSIDIHPGIVNGQLKFLGHQQWQFGRKLHEKVRLSIAESVPSDGYGQ